MVSRNTAVIYSQMGPGPPPHLDLGESHLTQVFSSVKGDRGPDDSGQLKLNIPSHIYLLSFKA